MKVGDLVREKALQRRTGVVVEKLRASRLIGPRGEASLLKVLWTELSPTSPTLIGAAWCNQLEIINESR